MDISQIRKEINNLKIHLDFMDQSIAQTINMIYSLEEKIMDIEDGKIKKNPYSRDKIEHPEYFIV